MHLRTLNMLRTAAQPTAPSATATRNNFDANSFRQAAASMRKVSIGQDAVGTPDAAAHYQREFTVEATSWRSDCEHDVHRPR